jgi:hypothetical protein
MSSSKAGKTWQGNGRVILPMKHLFCFLTYHKILQHGADGFTSALKEVTLWILIALKIHHPWPGFNP